MLPADSDPQKGPSRLAGEQAGDQGFEVADIFQEVDEDLRRDKALDFWKRYQTHIIAAAILAVALAAGISGWRYYSQAQREAAGSAYAAVMEAVAKDPKTAQAQIDALVAKGGGTGFALLAKFQQANEVLKAGDAAKASDLFAAIANDGSVDRPLKDLAAILAGLARLDSGKPAEAAALVQPLTAEGNAYRFSALEISGLAAFAAGDKAKAKDLFTQLKQLAALPNAPRSLAVRADMMLDRLKD